MNTIAVDAMGGDSAPVDLVKGAIEAKQSGVNVVLCGDQNLIKPYLDNVEIPIYHYPQVISMDEDPMKAICLLYTSPSPRDATLSRMPSSA